MSTKRKPSKGRPQGVSVSACGHCGSVRHYSTLGAALEGAWQDQNVLLGALLALSVDFADTVPVYFCSGCGCLSTDPGRHTAAH